MSVCVHMFCCLHAIKVRGELSGIGSCLPHYSDIISLVSAYCRLAGLYTSV